MAVTVAVAAVVAVLAGGFFGVQRLAGEPGRFVPAVPELAAAGRVPVTWVSAMVARDGATVTVYSGAGWCREITDVVAAVVVDGETRVEIAVTARIVEVDCSIDGAAVPVSVTLATPLDGRELVDAAAGQPRPTYLERHLPDVGVDGRWSPVGGGSWSQHLESWHDSYNGPNGSLIRLSAQPIGSPRPGRRAGTISLGPYRGTIVGSSSWTVYWEVDEVTYGLTLEPSESGEVTLDQFKRELALLTWR